MKNEKIYQMAFSAIYSLYIQKAVKKNRTPDEVDTIILWLTGYDKKTLQKHLNDKTTVSVFFDQARMHPHVSLIKGMICGYRVEEIEDKHMQKIRYLDKLIDELSRGRAMEKILRK